MKLLLLLFTLSSFIGSQIKDPVRVTQLMPAEVQSQSKTFLNGQQYTLYKEYFIIPDYQENQQREIPDFVSAFLKKGTFTATNYEAQFYFFRQSDKTNIQAITANPSTVAGYSMDADLIGSIKVKNGRLVTYTYRNQGNITEMNLNIIQ